MAGQAISQIAIQASESMRGQAAAADHVSAWLAHQVLARKGRAGGGFVSSESQRLGTESEERDHAAAFRRTMRFSSCYQVLAVQLLRKLLLYRKGRAALTAHYRTRTVWRTQAAGETSVSLALTGAATSMADASAPFIAELQTPQVREVWDRAYLTLEDAGVGMQRYITDIKRMDLQTFLRHVHPDGPASNGIAMITMKVDLMCEGDLNPWCCWGLHLLLVFLMRYSQLLQNASAAARKADAEAKLELFKQTQLLRIKHEHELVCVTGSMQHGDTFELTVVVSGSSRRRAAAAAAVADDEQPIM